MRTQSARLIAALALIILLVAGLGCNSTQERPSHRPDSDATAILMIVTSASTMTSGKATGLWLEEYAVPYQAFRDAGFTVTTATIDGAPVPIDPRSEPEPAQRANWSDAVEQLATPIRLDTIDIDAYDAVFIPGGHGVMFDLADSRLVARTIARFDALDRPIAAVCHGPGALVNVVRRNGRPLVEGRTVAAFTNAEESAVGLEGDMPFLLESKLIELGASISSAPDFQAHAVRDGNLITGQNPASSAQAAQLLIEALN